MDFSHAAVWMDHQDATIVHFNAEQHSVQHIRNPGGATHLHHKAGTVGSGHASHHEPYYSSIAQALASTSEIFIVGPGTTRSEFIHFVEHHDPALRPHVLGTEPSSRMSERQLLARAREWFEPVDRMRGTSLR